MKPSDLRAFMQRYGNPGVLAVGLYLGANHLWRRRRSATLLAAGGLLAVGTLFCVRHTRPLPSPGQTPLPIGKSRVALPVLAAPQPQPLFDRAKKRLHVEESWSWEGCDHAEYRWLSDSELFFAEAYSDGGRVDSAHLYRYNVHTGKKTPLKRLEGLIDCFYHSQMEISPDGKWLLWHGGTDTRETLDAATLDGRHHRQWPGGFYRLHHLAWTGDSQHWIEFEHEVSDQGASQLLVHNVYRPAASRRIAVTAENGLPNPEGYIYSDQAVSVDPIETRTTTKAIHLTVTALSPKIQQTRTTRIDIPAHLPNPNVAEALLSPNGKRLAFIVGYGSTPVITDAEMQAEAEAGSASMALFGSGTRDRPGESRRDYTLFVCNIDGTEMHAVGGWQEETNPNVVLELENLQWLPGGKSLSFFHEDYLYTVPAD